MQQRLYRWKKVQTNVTVQKILRVKELLAYVDTYIHQASNLKIPIAKIKFYADQDVRDATQVLCDEYRHELGDPQKRHESNNRSKAEKSVDIYIAFQT